MRGREGEARTWKVAGRWEILWKGWDQWALGLLEPLVVLWLKDQLAFLYSTTLCWSLPPQSFVCRACILSICPAVKQPEYKKVLAWCSQKLSTQSWVWAVTLANVSSAWNAVLSWTKQSVNLDGIKSVVTAGKNGGECWKIHSHAKIFYLSRTKSLVKWALLTKSGLKV